MIFKVVIKRYRNIHKYWVYRNELVRSLIRTCQWKIVMSWRLLTHLPLVPHIYYLIGSALVQTMACRLFGAKTSSKPMLKNKRQWHFNQNTKFSFTKTHLNISSAKWQPFCPGGDALNILGLCINEWVRCIQCRIRRAIYIKLHCHILRPSKYHRVTTWTLAM